MFRTRLSHPKTRGLDIDDPCTTQLRRQIIQQNNFLRQTYNEWYAAIAAALPDGPGPLLELGSGAGFLKEHIPGLITSEIFYLPGVDAVLDGQQLPIASEALQGIVMVDVLHHLPQPRRFFAEAERCLQPGGVIIMVEPWVTTWSRAIYRRLHPEPFRPEATLWEFPSSGPLSGANEALPWMVFERDRARFQQEFPRLEIRKISLTMPFRYLISGGFSLVSLCPGWTFGIWRRVENLLKPWMRRLAMFAQIELVKN
jgi:SAM-dependent methyltransferase